MQKFYILCNETNVCAGMGDYRKELQLANSRAFLTEKEAEEYAKRVHVFIKPAIIEMRINNGNR